jgi:small subunit ribosomal protein S3
MGQKANPNSVRLVLNKNWKSKWFSERNYTIYFLEDVFIRRFINKKLGRQAGIALINIGRDAQQVHITITTSKPGILIGRSGQGISDLSKSIEQEIQRYKSNLTFATKKLLPQIDEKNKVSQKIKIDVVELKDPELNAVIMAQTIATQLEKRVGHRRAVKQAINKVMQKKARGVKVRVAGRLNGVEIARKELFSEGSIPLSTFRSNVDFAQENAHTVYGIIGIKVWIYR